jgi:1-acyl-sn-glycerol-3-phosphate acyltransferase
MENIPKGRNVIILSNHIGFFDPFFLNAVLPGWYNFVVFAKVVFNPYTMFTIRNTGFVVRPSGHYLVGSSALLKIEECVNNGESFILFPSENVIYDGSIGKVKQALYRIIQDTDAVILPVYLKDIMRQVFYQKPFRAKVVIGRPLSKTDILSGRDEFIRKAIQSLSP